ncbi:MAG: excalibur calcium-binding domain-containing protein [Mycobacterium sp.]
MPSAVGRQLVTCGCMGATWQRRGATASASLVIATAWLSVPLARQAIPAPSATSATLADPPYQDCNAARADGRYSIPYYDPAYRPDLDPDGNGLACEPSRGRRSTR